MPDVMMAFADPNNGNTKIYTFGVETAAYSELERTSTYRWEKKAVVGAKPHSDPIGPDLDTASFRGKILPHYKGGLGQIDAMRELMNKGKPVRWVDGLGKDRGQWVIKKLSETNSEFFSKGVPLKIEFTINLEEYGGGYLPN